MKFKTSILFLALAAAAAAQQSNAYLFVAPGAAIGGSSDVSTLHVGVGADIMIARVFGANVEIGALGPSRDLSAVRGVFSPGATYYFRHGNELRFEPFVAGGYSLMFRGGNDSLAYFGGGVNCWFARTTGVRLELRDHYLPAPCNGCTDAHFVGFRIALALRRPHYESHL